MVSRWVANWLEAIGRWAWWSASAAGRFAVVLLLLRLAFYFASASSHALQSLLFGATVDDPGCLGPNSFMCRAFAHLKALINATATVGLAHHAAGYGPWDWMFVALWVWALWQLYQRTKMAPEDRPVFASQGFEGRMAKVYAAAVAEGFAVCRREAKGG